MRNLRKSTTGKRGRTCGTRFRDGNSLAPETRCDPRERRGVQCKEIPSTDEKKKIVFSYLHDDDVDGRSSQACRKSVVAGTGSVTALLVRHRTHQESGEHQQRRTDSVTCHWTATYTSSPRPIVPAIRQILVAGDHCPCPRENNIRSLSRNRLPGK